MFKFYYSVLYIMTLFTYYSVYYDLDLFSLIKTIK